MRSVSRVSPKTEADPYPTQRRGRSGDVAKFCRKTRDAFASSLPPSNSPNPLGWFVAVSDSAARGSPRSIWNHVQA